MKPAAIAFTCLLLLALAPVTSGLPPPASTGPILAITTPGSPVPAALVAAGFSACLPFVPVGDCFDTVDASAFATADLTGRVVLFVGTHDGPGPVYNALVARAADIAAFISGGGTLLTLAEPTSGLFAFVPDDNPGPWYFVASAPGNAVTILPYGSTHPALSGITSAMLTGWGPSWRRTIGENPTYLFPLASGAPETARRVMFAGNYGTGCVLVTQLEADVVAAGPHPRSADAASFLQAIIDWGLQCAPVPPYQLPYGGGVRIQYSQASGLTSQHTGGLNCSGIVSTPNGYEVTCVPAVAPPPSGVFVCFGHTVLNVYAGLASLKGTTLCDGTVAASCTSTSTMIPAGACVATSGLAVADFPLRCVAKPGTATSPLATWTTTCGSFDP